MRARLIYFFVFCTLGFLSCDNDNNIDNPDEKFFLKMYGGDGEQSAVDMEVLSDGSVLLLGTSVSEGVSKIYLVKISSTGKVLWDKKLGGSQETAVDIEPAANGNFVIASNFLNMSATAPNIDAKIILINGDGVKLDSAMRELPADQTAKSVTPLLDGGFIVTGSAEEITTGQTNLFFYRCNAAMDWFTTNWTEDYTSGNNSNDAGRKVYQMSSNLFYVFGQTDQTHDNQSTKATNLFFFYIDAFGRNGNPAFTGKIDVNAQLASIAQLSPTLGGNFVLLGTQYNGSSPSALQLSVLRNPLTFRPGQDMQIDTQLSVEGRTLNAVDVCASTAAPAGYFLLSNEARTLAPNIWLAKIDQSANILWSVSLGSENQNDVASTVKELPDGRILVLGTVSVGDNQSKMALFKLNSNGRLQE